jgi:hypothetical protein
MRCRRTETEWIAARARLGFGLLCLTAIINNPGWSAPSDPPNPSTFPCTDFSATVARDTHVFFSDVNLERLALRLSSSLYADQNIYNRLVRDIKMIRARNSELRSITYRVQQDAQVLNVYFKPSNFWLARTRLYGDWNCLNQFLGAQIIFHPEFDYAELTFAGLYNPDLISKAYRALPGVTMTEYSSMLGDSSSIYITRDDAVARAADVWHYVFDIAGGDCPAGCTEHDLHYFEVTADGRIQRTATWNSKSQAPPPDWATAYFRKYR